MTIVQVKNLILNLIVLSYFYGLGEDTCTEMSVAIQSEEDV